MGEVWLAEHTLLKRPDVALKFILPDLLESLTPDAAEEYTERFWREARAAADIPSEHVVQIVDCGYDNEKRPYIAMEYIEGETLANRIDRGVLSPFETARIIGEVAEALSHAHGQGIVHRDLKPSNILLDANGRAKVADFGLAKYGEDSLTRSGDVHGSVHYMSPEQCNGLKHVDARTDMWALGVICVECLTGTLPFDADSFVAIIFRICQGDIPAPSQFGPVPAGFDEWFGIACERNRERRFRNVREAATLLRTLCAAPAEPSPGSRIGASAPQPMSTKDWAILASAPTERPIAEDQVSTSAASVKPARRVDRAFSAVLAALLLLLIGAAVKQLLSGVLQPVAPQPNAPIESTERHGTSIRDAPTEADGAHPRLPPESTASSAKEESQGAADKLEPHPRIPSVIRNRADEIQTSVASNEQRQKSTNNTSQFERRASGRRSVSFDANLIFPINADWSQLWSGGFWSTTVDPNYGGTWVRFKKWSDDGTYDGVGTHGSTRGTGFHIRCVR